MKLNKLFNLTTIFGAGILCLFYFCNTPKIFQTIGLDAIPEDASFIFCLSPGRKSYNALNKTSFWKSLCQDNSISSADRKFKFLDSLLMSNNELKKMWEEEDTYISIHPTKARDFDLLTVFKHQGKISDENITSWAQQWNERGIILYTRIYENIKIHEFRRNDSSLVTLSGFKGLLLVSSTSFLVEDAIRHLKSGASIGESKAFKKVMLPASNKSTITLYVNHLGLQDYLKSFINRGYSSLLNAIGSFARWDGLSVELQTDKLNFTGTSASLDTTDLILAFRNQNTTQSKMDQILPIRTAFCLRFGSDDLRQTLVNLHSNNLFFDQNTIPPENTTKQARSLSEYLNTEMLSWIGDEIALFITEPGSTFPDNNTFALIASDDTSIAKSSLQRVQRKINAKIIFEKYKQYDLGRINSESILADHFGKQFKMLRNPWYTVLNNYVIFSNQISSLKGIIDDLEIKNTLASTLSKQELENFTLASNVSMYLNFPRSLNLLYTITNPEMNSAINKKTAIWDNFGTFQFNLGNSKDNVNFHAQMGFVKDQKKELSLIWSADLENKIALPPVILEIEKNKYNVVSQDVNTTLYYFDESGNLIWNKNIGEKILSRIYVVDYYKNGDRQIFFSTQTKLFLLDNHGKNVARYPIKLPSMASNGAAVIDIEGRNNNSIYVACENRQVYAYDISGKPVADWQSDRSLSGIDKRIELVQSKTTRSLLIQSNQGIYLSDRRGKMKLFSKTHNSDSNSLLNILQDSTGSSMICMSDSLNLHSLSTEGIIKKVWPSYDFAISYSLTNNNKRKDFLQGVLYSDSIVFKDINSRTSCSVNRQNLDSYDWVNTVDNKLNTWAGLSSTTRNQFILIDSECNIPKGFPIQGCGNFSIFMSPKSKNTVLSIGNQNSTIYIYHLE